MKTALKWLLRNLKAGMKRVPFLREAMREVQLETSYFSYHNIHESMLADKVRMDSYAKAINKHVRKGDIVVYLGTGTGILSFFAALREPQRIYAVEVAPIIEVAKFLADRNKFDNIVFVNEHSRAMKIPEKVDLILHEQMGEFLFEEEMVPNILDLRRRILKENGRILPSNFEVFFDPVKLKDDCTIPLIWEHGFFNFSSLKQFENYTLRRRVLRPEEIDYFLCDPEIVLSFDLETIEDGDSLNKIAFTKRITRKGRLDGCCFYFNTIFDEEISFSTSPLAEKTVWGSRLFTCETKECEEGDTIRFELTINDLGDHSSWQWRYEDLYCATDTKNGQQD
jgi:protein arginine N-methyltransferase 1